MAVHVPVLHGFESGVEVYSQSYVCCALFIISPLWAAQQTAAKQQEMNVTLKSGSIPSKFAMMDQTRWKDSSHVFSLKLLYVFQSRAPTMQLMYTCANWAKWALCSSKLPDDNMLLALHFNWLSHHHGIHYSKVDKGLVIKQRLAAEYKKGVAALSPTTTDRSQQEPLCSSDG